MPYEAPDLAKLTLSDIAELVAARKLPPVESWEPANVGDSEMRIASDGKWFHQGGEITRPSMIRAFSSLLRRDADGRYWLVTPQQKLSIIVDDAPFIAVELQSEGEGPERSLAFRLNSDDLIFADADHAIEMRGGMLYVHVRGGLFAKLARPVYYELANLALAESPEAPSIWSKGAQFQLAAPA
ncbi:DUF1285 domain-containing protein [Sphingorhabdus sp. EL138]|uniref:DUF1285 domain-containing protein n=1 Tax=Sphingorhabdus sp. EL138 TaxID=2073156 RepID=UPI002600679F|nr:DUF1285 domain-containing protein [Sphingorhabdus sp. EL138]